MAITIISEPSQPCFAKNRIRYEVATNNKFAVKARLFIESAPYSDNYLFTTELKALPDANGLCFFYFSGILKENLQHDTPDLFAPQSILPNVSKRFRVDFFEDDPAQLTLVDELYHESSDSSTLSYREIAALESGANYVLILNTDKTFEFIRARSGGDTDPLSALYNLGDEQWFNIINLAAGTYDEIQIPGFTRATLYTGLAYVITSGEVRSALLAGGDIRAFYKSYQIFPPEFTAAASSTSSLSIVWINDINADSGVEIQYDLDASTFGNIIFKDANINSHEITGLTTGNTVYIRMRSKRNNQVSNWSEVVSVELKEWALASETWDDAGYWYDNENWID